MLEMCIPSECIKYGATVAQAFYEGN